MKKNFFFFTIFMLGCFFCNMKAQSLGDLLNKNVLSNVVSKVTGSSSKVNLEGTWVYEGPAVEFESKNLLKEAGGAVASASVEKKLDNQFRKVGIKPGITHIQFNSDGTFSMNLKNKTGNYTYEPSKSELILKFANLISNTAKISTKGSNEISLLFNSDKLLRLMTAVGSSVGNTTLKTISSLAGSYDGMEVGLTLKKK